MSEFFIRGDATDLGYTNVRDHERHADTREFISHLWNVYEQYADPHFREDARNHFLQRFWEMYLTVTLLERGHEIYRIGEEGPEFYIQQKDRRIWVEAVAPGPGEGKDRVTEAVSGVAEKVPTEKILLRYTHALAEKRNKYEEARKKEIISPNDSYLLAINCRSIPHAPFGDVLPYFIQAYLPFGPYAVSIDRETGDIVESFHQYREAVTKLNGSNIPTTAFLDTEYGCISAVLNSSVDCVNKPTILGEDFSVLHNPSAINAIDIGILSWCDQKSLNDNELITIEPNKTHNSDAANNAAPVS